MGIARLRHPQEKEKKEEKVSAFNQLINPRGTALKKWMMDLLKERYPQHEPMIERIGHQFASDAELHAFGKMEVDLFEIGYLKCMNDYKKKLDELGVKVTVVPEN